jgi:hypothetical protein
MRRFFPCTVKKPKAVETQILYCLPPTAFCLLFYFPGSVVEPVPVLGSPSLVTHRPEFISLK